MKHLLRWPAVYPVVSILFVLTLTLVFATQLSKLRIGGSADSLMAGSGPEHVFYAEVEKRFGSTDDIAVVIHDSELFTTERLALIPPIIRELEALLFVDGSESLFNLKEGKTVNDEILFSAYLTPLPATQAALDEVRVDALNNPFVAESFISSDASSLAINLRLKDRVSFSDEEINNQIDLVLAPIKEQFSQVFALGEVQVNAGINARILEDQLTLLPLAISVLLLALWLTLGRFIDVAIPLLTSVISIVWTLAFMVVAGIDIHMMTSIVPVLILILGSTEDVHLLSAFHAARAQGLDRVAAISTMAEHAGLAVFLTFLTTSLGFLSIAINDLKILQDFAFVGAVGLTLNFVVTALLLPAILVLVPNRKKVIIRKGRMRFFENLSLWLYRQFGGRPKQVFAVVSFITLIALYAASNLRVDSDTLGYFPENDVIHQKSELLSNQLSGMETLELVVSSPIQDTFQQVRYLNEVRKLQRYLDETGYFDKTLSLVDYVQVANRLMDDLPPDVLELPEEDDVLKTYFTLSDTKKLRPLVNDEFNKTRITVRHSVSNSAALNDIVEEVRAYINASIDPGLNVVVTGRSVLSAMATESLVTGQAESFLVMVVAIFIIVTILFVGPRAGLVALIPNLIPVALMFGVMAIAQVPLNSGTAILAAIAIGISIDDTVHILVRYSQEMRRHQTYQLAVLATLEGEAKPILSTSVSLAVGLGVLAFSQFPPIHHFGLLGGLIMILAMVSNLVLMPALLVYVRLATVWDVLEVDLKTKLQNSSELLDGLSKLEARRLLATGTPMEFSAGSTIIDANMLNQSLFLILSGEVVYTCSQGKAETINMHSGNIFGEGAMYKDLACTESAKALTLVEAIAFQPEELIRFSRLMPRTIAKVGFNLARILAKRNMGSVT